MSSPRARVVSLECPRLQVQVVQQRCGGLRRPCNRCDRYNRYNRRRPARRVASVGAVGRRELSTSSQLAEGEMFAVYR